MTQSRFLLAVLALACGAAYAQETPAPPGEAATSAGAGAAPLIAALEGWKGTADLLLEGRTFEEKGQADGFGGATVIIAGAGASEADYAGRIELLRSADDLMIVSRGVLPGVAILRKGERTLCRTTFEDEPVGCHRVANDLVSLLDFDRLIGALKAATVETKAGSGGEVTHSVTLPKRVVRSVSRGGFDLAQPKVLRVDARFTLDAAGKLAKLRFDVVRSDPFAKMTRRAIEQGTGGTVEASAEDLGGDDEGAITSYELQLASGGPSERLREERAALRKAAGDGR